jgi:hypothetical protein
MRQFITLIEKLLTNTGITRNPYRISTRLPTGKTATENPFDHALTVDVDSAKKDPKSFEHNVNLVKGYAAIPHDLHGGSHEEVADHFINHVKDNLLWLHDKMPEAVRERARKWYDGANKLTEERAREYGLPHSTTAAVYAALSPQKAWHENVALGDRVLEAFLRKQKSGWTDAMEAVAQRIWMNDRNRPIHMAIKDKKLSQLEDIDHIAAWIRTYDEAHNPNSYQTVEPEGRLGRPYTNRDAYGHGTKNPEAHASVRWGSLAEIGKAVAAINAGDDLEKISELMGERHKVRNFYNNIVDPNGQHGDVTIDTHAVAGGLLHPLGGNTTEVAHNFKNSLPAGHKDSDTFVAAKGSVINGVKGTYPLYADAYRRAAKERNLLAREMQSITWEAAKGLFNGKGNGKAKHLAQIKSLWQQYQSGKMSAHDVREKIHDLSGGIAMPDWASDQAGKPSAAPVDLGGKK